MAVYLSTTGSAIQNNRQHRSMFKRCIASWRLFPMPDEY